MTALNVEKVDVSELPPVPLPPATPVEEILRQHRKRFIIHTEAHGDIILKYLTHSAHVQLTHLRYQLYPEVVYWEDELREVAPMAQLEGADEASIARVAELTAKLIPTVDIYAIACITNITLVSIEDLKVLMDALTPTEAEALRQILIVCTSHAPACDMTYLEIAERFHVQVVNELTMDGMTMQQAEVLKAIVIDEHKQERQFLKSMGVKRCPSSTCRRST